MINRPAHVQQKHVNGCVVACLAMVLGVSYERAHELISPTRRDPDKVGGFTYCAFDSVLVDHGFALARKHRYRPGNILREEWPPAPWADLHYATVSCTPNTTHAVLMLGDGTVIDPLTPEPRRLSDYVDVANVAAIVRVPCSRSPSL